MSKQPEIPYQDYDIEVRAMALASKVRVAILEEKNAALQAEVDRLLQAEKVREKLIYKEGDKLFAYNGKQIGEVLCKEDGFYDWWPETGQGGYWPADMLIAIGELLNRLNADWQKQLEEDLQGAE